MTDEELEALLEELEAGLLADVRAALALTAQDFADALSGATELTAARFSVSGIRGMWRRRVSSIMTRLRSVAGRAAEVAADDAGTDLPGGWDENLSGYTAATRALLDAVGDRLAAEATQSLAEGLNEGEDLDQLKARLATVFAASGTQLGEGRAGRIAVTEATRAFNAGTLAAAQAMTGPERPLVKQWITRQDARVRDAHRDTNGQLQLLDDAFDVDGTPMQYPGDPEAPAALTVGCRCVMRTAVASASASAEGTPVSNVTAAAEVHTGAMIALIPTEKDAARLALDGGEEASELHLTLYYLGEAADWTPEQQGHLISRVSYAACVLSPVSAHTFGAAQWNPDRDEPVWVWNVGDDLDTDSSRLQDAHHEVTYAIEDGHDDPEIPQQYSPWAPHVCAVYSADDWSAALVSRVGPLTFDRVRVAFAGEYTDIPLTGGYTDTPAEPVPQGAYEDPTQLLTWSTPGDTALAFENQQTGDGRVFAPGSLYWTDGPWPLQYADEMNGGHDGARLAGAIFDMGRDGHRIPGAGVLYMNQPAAWEAAMLLAQGAPLGVSLDLDDVDLELVSMSPEAGAEGVYSAHLVTASVLPLDGGGWRLTGESAASWTASGTGTVGESSRVDIVAGADGTVPAGAFEVTAAAGDPGDGGTVLERQLSGEVLMRVTRARIRGATLVTIPAYDRASITLDDVPLSAASRNLTASAAGNAYDRVVRSVRKSLTPMTAADVAKMTGVRIADVRRHLARATQKGHLVRIAHGRYVKPVAATAATAIATAATVDGCELTASATGAVDLPVADRDTPWDGDAAATRVFDWADGDTSKLDQAFAYRDDDADPLSKASRKLGYCDVVDGTLTIIPRGLSAAVAALNGARGGVDIPAGEVNAVRERLSAVSAHVDEVTGGGERDDMESSAWSAMRDLPPMPAAWFAAPTDADLPPGGPGVNYRDGRIFGWVAQAGEPHAGYAKKVTIDGLGRIDTAHFLRQRFALDDGSTVRAGAFTMNAGHHRDGAECETSACQFDDTRTVAGIVTVGVSERGMWFSGAAAPWMSEWDRSVFLATQPSYHMKKGPSGNWQLRAVLAVPVPGHSSPLLAAAVTQRAQLALTAAATMAEVEDAVAAAADPATAATPAVAGSAAFDYDLMADAFVASLARAEQRRQDEAAELEALLAEGRELVASMDDGPASLTLDADTGTVLEGA